MFLKLAQNYTPWYALNAATSLQIKSRICWHGNNNPVFMDTQLTQNCIKCTQHTAILPVYMYLHVMVFGSS